MYGSTRWEAKVPVRTSLLMHLVMPQTSVKLLPGRMFVVSASPAPEVRDNALARIAALAARLLDMPVSAILSDPFQRPELRASCGPFGHFEQAIFAILAEVKNELTPGMPVVMGSMQRPDFAARSFVALSIPGWNGNTTGILVLAGANPVTIEKSQLSHLADLATLAGNELELAQRRTSQGSSVERRKTQEQLLEKTLELAKFGEDLRQLHRLSTTNYESLDELFQDYLETGKNILGLQCGTVVQVRGRYAAVRAVRCDSHSMQPGMTFELGQVYCGLVFAERCTMASSAASQEERLVDRPHYGPMRPGAYIGAPILVDGEEVYGVLSFASVHARWAPFSSHEIEIIELMAKGIGRSILEGRMQEARERADALEQDRSQVLEMVAKDQPLDAVLDRIAKLVERQSASITVAIHVVHEDRIYCAAAPSMPALFRKRMQAIPLTHAAACSFSAAFSRRTEIYETYTPHCKLEFGGLPVHEYCWQACGASPILSATGELMGLLIGYSKVAVQPRFVDRELLEMASSLALIAMEHRRLTERLAYHALHDVLTGLPNRTMLTRALDEKVRQAEEQGQELAVVFVDLDRFKQINDHFGHAAGDAVLRETAERIHQYLRNGEIAARLGGDEFVAVLAESAKGESAFDRSQGLLEKLRAPIAWNGELLYVTASVGISMYPQGGDTAEALLGNADLAMYRVKNSGRNDVHCFGPELQGPHFARLELEHSLRRALEQNELELNFQPIIDIRSARGLQLDGFEVLLSWQHPVRGRISPTQFIPVAEECGLIADIGSWVLTSACEQCKAWQNSGLPVVPLSVNVSAIQFARADFVETVERALLLSGLSPSLLTLELTESAIMEEISAATVKLKRLRHLGVRLALDDFGTGYSSLGYLRWIPVDCLKIDQSFLAEIETSESAFALVQTIVALADNMGLTVVAEGVEIERQVELLREIGCGKAQGHLFGAALPSSEAMRWLAACAANR